MKKYFSFVILLVIACAPVSGQNFKEQIAAKATYNDQALVKLMLPSLEAAAGKEKVYETE